MTADIRRHRGSNLILYEVRDAIAFITLNRAGEANAFHLPMYHEFRRVRAAEADEPVRA